MIAFIDDHRQAYGVEPICRVLPIAPSTYHAHAGKRANSFRLPERVRRDADLKVEIRRVFEENFRVYGVRKVWRQLRREGISVARCTVARLIRNMGLRGAIRGKPLRTTISDKATPCPLARISRRRGLVFRDPTMIARWPWRGRARPWRGLRGWGRSFGGLRWVVGGLPRFFGVAATRQAVVTRRAAASRHSSA